MNTAIQKKYHWFCFITVATVFIVLLTLASQAFGAINRKYTWIDFDGTQKTVTFAIQSPDIAESEKEFGATPGEMSTRKVSLTYRIKYPSNASPQLLRRLKEKAKADSERKAQAMLNSQRLNMLSHGYSMVGKDKVGVDLSAAWNRNRRRMNTYVEQFTSQTGVKLDICPSQMLAFVQQIEYRKPPDMRAGLCILQFLPPVEALNAGYGDCDTKTILFASLVDNGNGPEVIALRGPDHVIAGLECKSDASGYIMNVFGKSFLLCECSSPSWPPGSLSEDIYKSIKRGEYTPIRLRHTITSSVFK